MSKRYSILVVLVVCGVLIIGISALEAQNSVTIEASKDATIFNNTGANGSGVNFFVGRAGTTSGGNVRRGLIAFDIENSGVPSGATIESVTLTLNMSRTAIAVGDVNIVLHRVLADWGEGPSTGGGGTGGGLPGTAATGDVTWTHRFFDTQTWMTPGGHFSSTVSASQSVGGFGTYTWSGSGSDQIVADAQMWLDDSGSNFGWILIGDESNQSAKRFESRESDNGPMLTVAYIGATSVEDNAAIPTEFALTQNYPNPFNPETKIHFALTRDSHVVINIYNTLGQQIGTLIDTRYTAGFHSVRWDGKDRNGRPVSSGVYLYQIQAGEFSQVKKMSLIR